MIKAAYCAFAVVAVVTIAIAHTPKTTTATVSGQAYVIDGDTVVVNGVHFRLHGIDAPEMLMPHGPKSRAVMVHIVAGQIITCRPDGTRSHDRIVASCFLADGTDIGRELVRRGWALDCQRYSHGRYRGGEPAGVRQKLTQAPYC